MPLVTTAAIFQCGRCGAVVPVTPGKPMLSSQSTMVVKASDLEGLPVACLQQPVPTCTSTKNVVSGHCEVVTIDGESTVTDDVQIMTDGGATVSLVSDGAAMISAGSASTAETRLTVTDATGMPLAGMRVRVVLPDDSEQELEADENGIVTVSVTPIGAAIQAMPIDVGSRIGPAPPPKSEKIDLKPGMVLVGARDLDSTLAIVGRHQFLVLIPDDPNCFEKTVDLGNGVNGIIIGAFDEGYLETKTNQEADLAAVREYVDPYLEGTFWDYDTEVSQVQIPGSHSADSYIRLLLNMQSAYKENERDVPYPNWFTTITNRGRNSNSWAQSMIEYSGGTVREDFSGRDLGRQLRLPEHLFR